MKKRFTYHIYILTNKGNTVFYIGVTNNIVKRIFEHKTGFIEGFTQKYSVHDLLYYEIYEDPENAILREKQIKGWSRKKKENLIIEFNPGQRDLYEEIIR